MPIATKPNAFMRSKLPAMSSSTSQLHVLVVDDQLSARQVLRHQLEQLGHRVSECGDPAQVLLRMAVAQPDVLVLDVEMPMLNGYQVAARVRAQEAGGWTPIVFLSSRDSDDDLWAGIEAGGDDYLMKPVSLKVLGAKLRSMQRQLMMRERLEQRSAELREANAQLAQLTQIDPLTGLLNRRGLDQRLHAMIEECRLAQQPLSVLLIDVDHFKRYNDALGHGPGDDALRRVAELLRQACLRQQDVAARFGGEEFVLLLPATPRSGAMTLARGLLRTLNLASIAHPDSPTAPHLTISGGVTTCVPDSLTTAEGLLLRADDALYTAKGKGRARFFSYEYQLDTEEQRPG